MLGKLCFITDPLTMVYGPLQPPLLIAKELRNRYEIEFITVMVTKEIQEYLNNLGFRVESLKKRFCFSGSLQYFEAWLRQVNLKLNQDAIIINFSNSIMTTPCHIYYGLGPITKALNDMLPDFGRLYKFTYRLLKKPLHYLEKKRFKELTSSPETFIACSTFCAEMYRDFGIHADKVIFPPIDTMCFNHKSSKPSGDYVLAYFGKETPFHVLKRVADWGIKLKIFGSKMADLSLKHRNMEILGKVTEQELVDLYSNALFTIFPFNHEPFGYIPVESMACGTPVLTYRKQGPKETVVHGSTGWLVNNEDELIILAHKLWRDSYSSQMRQRARERSLIFDQKIIARQWLSLINNLEDLYVF